MSMQDTLADMFTRIRNAQQAGHMNVSMPSSKIKKSVAAVLEAEGYISGFSVDSEVKPTMTIDLKYYEGSVQKIDRVPAHIKQLYATAFEVEPRWLVDAASIRQKWIDQAQSLNLY
ncbi:MAG: 30S ribosomal protein S8, partial [Thalassolituus sp.]